MKARTTYRHAFSRPYRVVAILLCVLYLAGPLKDPIGFGLHQIAHALEQPALVLGHQVKVRGFRIELGEIESQMEVLTDIKRASVVLLKKDLPEESATGAILIGYYTGKQEYPKAELLAQLADALPRYMIPEVFCFLDTFPLTQNGKIDKQALQTIGLSLETTEASFVAPRNEIEELVESIWREVLDRDPIGVHENFVSLGGHSLAAIRVTARLNKELELDLKLSKIFEHPTIEEYSIYLEQTLRKLLNT